MSAYEFPRVIWEFVTATNTHDLEWLQSLFMGDCTITACGYSASGLPAVAQWLEAEMVTPEISLSINSVRRSDASTTLAMRAQDHGAAHECVIEFITKGRYIQSLDISARPTALSVPPLAQNVSH